MVINHLRSNWPAIYAKLSVQQTPLVRDLVLLLHQIGDQQLEVGVGQRCEIGQRFHGPPFLVEGSSAVKQRTCKGST